MGYLKQGQQSIKIFLADDSGQAMTEYVLIMGVIVLGAGLMSRGLMDVFDRGIRRLGGQLEKDLKSGRAPLIVWKN
jgi:hypothetical protein